MGAAAKSLGTVSNTMSTLSALSPIEAAERRKHGVVYNYWLSLRGDRPYPSIWDLDPFEITDVGANSVMLDLSKDRENPEIFVGQALRSEGPADDRGGGQPDAQALLSCILNNYHAVLEKPGPIAFEDKRSTDGSRAIWCFGTLLPFTSTGSSIDYIFGLISWREGPEDAASQDAVSGVAETNAAVADEAVPEATLGDGPGDPTPENVVLDQAQPDDALCDGIAPNEVPLDDVPSSVVASDVADEAVDDHVLADDAAPDQAAAADPIVSEIVPDDVALDSASPSVALSEAADAVVPSDAQCDDVSFHELVSDDAVALEGVIGGLDLADATSDEAMPNDAAFEDAATPEAVSGDPELAEATSGEAMPSEVPTEDAVKPEAATGEPELGEARFDEAVPSDTASDPVPPVDDASSGNFLSDNAVLAGGPSRIIAFAKAMFGGVRYVGVPGDAVGYDRTPEHHPSYVDAPACDAPVDNAASAAAPADGAASEDAAPTEAVLDAKPSEDAGSHDAGPGATIRDDAAPDDGVSAAPEAGPSAEAGSEQDAAEESVSDDSLAADAAVDVVPARAVIVPMVPYASLFDDDAESDALPTAGDSAPGIAVPDVAVPEHAVIMPMVSHERLLEEAEPDDPAAEQEVHETDEVPVRPEAAMSEHQDETSGVPDRSDDQAQPAGPAEDAALDDLRAQLSVAQAVASAAPDASYHSRAALYVALGHAYDFALAAEADPEAYRKLLDEAGLEHLVQAPMTPVVELVFGTGYDSKRLTEFAAALSWARRAKLQPGSLAGHLEFLEAGLAIVAPV